MRTDWVLTLSYVFFHKYHQELLQLARLIVKAFLLPHLMDLLFHFQSNPSQALKMFFLPEKKMGPTFNVNFDVSKML